MASTEDEAVTPQGTESTMDVVRRLTGLSLLGGLIAGGAGALHANIMQGIAPRATFAGFAANGTLISTVMLLQREAYIMLLGQGKQECMAASVLSGVVTGACAVSRTAPVAMRVARAGALGAIAATCQYGIVAAEAWRAEEARRILHEHALLSRLHPDEVQLYTRVCEQYRVKAGAALPDDIARMPLAFRTGVAPPTLEQFVGYIEDTRGARPHPVRDVPLPEQRPVRPAAAASASAESTPWWLAWLPVRFEDADAVKLRRARAKLAEVEEKLGISATAPPAPPQNPLR